MQQRTLLVALSLAFAGCATIAPPAVPDAAGISVPVAWNASADSRRESTDLASWWKRFDDPTLTTLIERALAANTELASAQAALRQARALDAVQRARLGPTLAASASVQRGKSGSGSASNLFQAGFDASWEPDVFGGQGAGVQASSADVQASSATLGDVLVSIAAEVAGTYIGLRGSQTRLVIANDNLASQQETLQITQWRVQAGLATSLDAEQARNAVEQTRAQLPALATSIAQARHAIALLTGQTAGELHLPDSLRSGLAVVPQPGDDLALAFPADTLRQRADVRGAEAKARAAAARVVQADAARLPSFSLSGSLGLSALTLGGLGSSDAFARSILGGLSATLFDGSALKAQVQAQQAGFDQAVASYRGTTLTALKDVEDALVALRNDRQRLATLRSAAEAADNAALLARQRYTSGLVDFQTVLTTQRTQLSSQDSVASATADLATDHVRLYKALGGGWTPSTGAKPA